jgi:carboxypeptidase T
VHHGLSIARANRSARSFGISHPSCRLQLLIASVQHDLRQMSLFHVSIEGLDRRSLTALGTRHRIVVVGHSENARTGKVIVDAYIAPRQERWLTRRGYAVTRLEEVDAPARQRQQEGRRGAAKRLARGHYGDVIWGGGYLTADEIERAMVLGEKNHIGYFERIALPYKTWEKRRCHAIRIGKRRGAKRVGICFISGVHGREWGGPDILVYFAIRLLRAYRDRQPIRLGRKSFTRAQVRRIVETSDIVIFPQVNPDGRRFSMANHPMWRKNRRPAPPGRGPRSIGVDINRNFPILWRFERHFAPGAVASTRNPGDYETYVGPRAGSEPETKNVIWLLDQFPQIRYFIDLHSYGETLLHGWGSDQNQSNDADMCFRNKAYDGKRGLIHDDVYREYMPAADQKLALQLGHKLADAIRQVRGRKYRVEQSVGLYPTAGSTDDYAYSRHFVDPSRAKIISYTMEWGRTRASTPFHPPYPEMRKVMREVTAGLLEFCLQARAHRR